MRTIIEPFRIWTVKPIQLTGLDDRQRALERAGYNLLRIPARDVLIDLITDSGTGALSARQWAGMMTADEAYVGSESLFHLEDAARALFGYRHVVPTHQGRAAKRLLISVLVEKGAVVPGNTHLQTTRTSIRAAGGEALELPIPEASALQAFHPFKGNIDTAKLEALIERVGPSRIPLVLMAVSSPAGGGQPVSLENLGRVRELTQAHRIPLFLDCAYFAENAYFVQQREAAWKGRSLQEIAAKMFGLADGVVLSARKDGIVHTGGLLAFQDDGLADRIRRAVVRTEGLATHGGLAGRDLEGMAIGLGEALDPNHLAHRFETVEHLAYRLARDGVPVVQPPGGHAVSLDARAFLPHLDPLDFPAQALACGLYLLGGIRAAEVGTFRHGGRHEETGALIPADQDLVRFSIPRRTYTRSHINYVIETTLELFANRHRVNALEMVEEGERRYVTAVLRPAGDGRLLAEEHKAELPPERHDLGTCSHPLLEQRRSTRAFAAMTPPVQAMERIVQSFRWAPSCGNRQPWRLVLTTTSPERKALDGSLSEGNLWALKAPVLGALAMNPEGANTVNGINYASFDAGLALDNLLLAATAEGMVAHPMAGYDEPTARRALGVPDPWRVVCLVAIGFPGDPASLDPETRAKDQRPRQRRPTPQVVCFDRWKDG